jgi:hypothetical protein
MPQNQNNAFYQDPITLDAAGIRPILITADVPLPTTPFNFEGARDIFAQLNIHEYLTTALTGSNNDLDFIARTPGAVDITVQYKDPGANNAILGVTVHAYLQTLLTGANNDFVLTAIQEGVGGNAITIALVDPAGNNAVESASVVGNAITINLATGSGGAITSTPATIAATIAALPAAAALVTVANAAGNSGAGAVTALTATHLAGSAIIIHLATGVAGAITSLASEIAAAVAADVLAGPLLVVNNSGSNTGVGIVTAMAQTPSAGPAGSSPTLDATLKHGIHPDALATHAAFAQKTAASTEFKTFLTVAVFGQWSFDIGGTATPVFAASIEVVFRP